MAICCHCGKGANYGIRGGPWICARHATAEARARWAAYHRERYRRLHLADVRPAKQIKLPRKIRLCRWCGKAFQPHRDLICYCTQECQRASRQMRERARSKRDRIRNRLNGKDRGRYRRDRDRFIAKYGVTEWRKRNAEKQKRRMLRIQDWLAETHRKRIRKALNGEPASAHTLELLGCTILEYKAHLESKFTGKMSWENRGRYWHIDHIVPCCMFDLRQPEEQRRCFHWSNQRPLWGPDNLKRPKKGAFQPLLMI